MFLFECLEQQRGSSRQQSDSKWTRCSAGTEEIHEESHAFCSHDQGKNIERPALMFHYEDVHSPLSTNDHKPFCHLYT